ncbi:MAG: hypothetical protein Sylvanvirus27_6 [Sylvanvirus sp.]|uniref:Uncharacterized protein n=1 Tax=Sylvanvirus sp. TaxID=2487774 RepID=A0A3G5AIT9_9VIRU|nr:MAG: hypothetical protein Sylvanvirus27_6 [Sylvanvirus sp.]
MNEPKSNFVLQSNIVDTISDELMEIGDIHSCILTVREETNQDMFMLECKTSNSWFTKEYFYEKFGQHLIDAKICFELRIVYDSGDIDAYTS